MWPKYLAMIVLPMAAALSLAHFAGRSWPVATPVAAIASPASNEWLARLSTPLAHFLLQLLVVLLVAKAAGWLLRRFGQPAVIGEMTAGLLLGPLLLGSLLPAVQGWLFAPDSLGALELISQLGVLMFLFVAGEELDLGELRGRRGFTLLVSHTGIALPFLSGVVLAWGLYREHAPAAVGFASFALFIGISLSVTAFPVLLRILADRGLSGTPLGQVATACAAVGDASAWCLLALLLLALGGALVTELLGIHALFGAFVAGVAVSGNGGAARSVGMPNLEAWKLGALMNTRGLMELIVLNLGYELGLIGDRLFAVLAIMALITTAMTGPLLGLIDRASRNASHR